MPELPEVEVVRRTLGPEIAGRRILTVEVHRGDLREPVDEPSLQALSGRRFRPPDRRGKYLLLPDDRSGVLALHFGMSGRLTLVPEPVPREKHEHLAWHLEGEERLRYVDARRFGLVLALEEESWRRDPHFAHLGLEPLGEEWSPGSLRRRAEGRRAPVKSFLMNARVVVGVGNIYASEALHRAGIHPGRSVARIGAARWKTLAEAVREVLEEGIARGGTTLRDFVDGTGAPGRNRAHLAVYDREGEPCPRCSRPVRRRTQAGRSTFYCPGCQH
ncbi:MAG: bifunctional DNA-formamidopyrimidine glycosylase/DNA-(apurinic or apyrimidinic site) lyase [Thermoanaerobaculia bacterium]|nr:bifunctional DNA-formamidopyrimidine glycosylase/DNA-(apurinic or apyrimidinic site) lyase [Thermoanaerobaculia bacterium]